MYIYIYIHVYDIYIYTMICVMKKCINTYVLLYIVGMCICCVVVARRHVDNVSIQIDDFIGIVAVYLFNICIYYAFSMHICIVYIYMYTCIEIHILYAIYWQLYTTYIQIL